MKRFFGALWGGLTTVRTAMANLLFLLLLVVLWTAFSADKPAPLPDRAALLLDLRGVVVDERTRVDAADFLFDEAPANREMVLTELIDSVRFAKDDPRMVALVLELDGLLSIGQSKTLELAVAIEDFRQSGKPVVAVGDYLTQDQYRLAVEADNVFIHPFGGVALEGLAYYSNYFAEALEKLAVTVHVFRAGEFKSIAEPFLRNDMSPGERAVAAAWLDDLWSLYTRAVERRRDLDEGRIDALLNNYPAELAAVGGNVGKFALQHGLVDDLLDHDQRDAYLRAMVGATDEEGAYAAVSFTEYLPRVRQKSISADRPNVAVITAQGNIMPGVQPPGTIGSESLVDLLRGVAARPGTKALVLRINSGGGSVFASEVIRTELARIREAGMPVVLSMGSIAASGAYYIATAADLIVATPATLTGSIGVFAAFPTVERLLARGGVSTDGVGTTALAGSVRLDRPLAPELAATLQLSVDDLYEQFLALVMDSRRIERPLLDTLAEGRVLSAEDAKASGLVDRLGGLDDAVVEAATLAGLDEGAYEVITIGPAFSPRQLLLQQISDSIGIDIAKLAAVPGLQAWLAPMRSSLDLLGSFTDPAHMYMRCLACDEY